MGVEQWLVLEKRYFLGHVVQKWIEVKEDT